VTRPGGAVPSAERTTEPPSPTATESAAAAPAPRPVRPRVDGVLVAVILGGAAVRFWGIGAQSLWYDEWLTTEATSGGLGDVVRHAATREGIPPPFFLLMWGWVRIFGDSEAALRTVSALAGVATIPVAYAIVREIGQPRRAARAAALLVAVSPALVWYSQEARPYSLLALFGALTVLTFLRVWRAASTARRNDLLLWGLACAAALAVHYFAVFLVVAEAAALFATGRLPWRRVALACVPAAVVLALLAPVALEQRSHGPNHQWISDWPLSERLREAGQSALVGPSPPDGRLWILAAAGVVLAGVLLATVATGRQRLAALLVAGVGSAAIVMALAAVVVGVDVFLSRYVIASLVPLIAGVAIGVAGPGSRWVGIAGVALLCAVSLTAVAAVARDPELQRSNWADVAEAFASGADDGRVLVVDAYGNLAGPLLHYLGEEARPLGPGETVRADRIDVVMPAPVTAPCNWFVGRGCALLFLGSPLPGAVTPQFSPTERIDLGSLAVTRYESPEPVPVSPEALLGPRVAGGLVLATD
jgi:Dolichyl-phosphate-mannose-protein mannosyltransferase